MKLKVDFIILSILLLSVLITSVEGKFRLKHSKTEIATNGEPKSLQDLNRDLHPDDYKIVPKEKPNLIDLNRTDFGLLNPYNEEMNNATWPKKKYSKDDKPYTLNPQNLSEINDKSILLVTNMSELKNIKGFNKEEKNTEERKRPVYQKDPYAYYDPIQSEKNIHVFGSENLFAVPIDLKSKMNEDEEKEIALRKSLIRREKYYYDPTHNITIEKISSGERALRAAAEKAKKPKLQTLYEYDKTNEAQAKAIKKFLGWKEPILFRDNPRVHYLLARQDVYNYQQTLKQNPSVTNPEIKKNEKIPYYNPVPAQK